MLQYLLITDDDSFLTASTIYLGLILITTCIIYAFEVLYSSSSPLILFVVDIFAFIFYCVGVYIFISGVIVINDVLKDCGA